MSNNMRFDIITIFPKIFDSYLNESMIKRAKTQKLVDINIHNLRDFSTDKHKKVDDRPFGGGPGMVLKVEPIIKAVDKLLSYKFISSDKKNKNLKTNKLKTKIVVFSAAGKQFTQKMAADWAEKYDQIIMIAGHYEGIDERIFKLLQATSYKLQAVSVGDYVLTGGELPAMIVIDAVSRHLPGFLGKAESLEEKRYGVGVPVYTRPEVFEYKKKKYRVPKILLSGDHEKIAEWRAKHNKRRLALCSIA